MLDYNKHRFSEAWALVKQITYKDIKVSVRDLMLYAIAAEKVRNVLQKNPPWLYEDREELSQIKIWCKKDYVNFCRQFDKMGITLTYVPIRRK